MTRIVKALLAATTLCVGCVTDPGVSAADCPPQTGVVLQVLGSGGPIADDGRSSSSYLVWIDGKARVMVDAGGGSFLRFGEARAKFEDLEIIGLSHFHTDHSADLPALLKSGYFSGRERPLVIAGPAAGEPFPGLQGFLAGLLDEQQGSFRYLSGYLDGTGGVVRIVPEEVDHNGTESRIVFDQAGLRVSAIGVPHGIVPAVAFRVDAGEHSIVFGTDQNLSSEAFPQFARDADLLVAHMVIPESAGPGARRLHATPSAIGAMAAGAGPSKLLVSHFMARSLAGLEENIGLVEERFDGKIILAEDLVCVRP